MKIAINGDIIDTELIYEITDVRVYINTFSVYFNGEIYFNINLFNNNLKQIKINVETYYSSKEKFMDFKEINKEFAMLSMNEREDFVKNTHAFKTALIKIENFRKEIVDIWSNHQSHIPQFNLD